MKLLLIGDVVGKPARKAVGMLLPELRKEFNIDFVIANAENLAHGFGFTTQTLNELFAAGVDAATTGNHAWAKPEGRAILEQRDSRVVRPANYPVGTPGVGAKIFTIATKSILVVNLMGRVFMKENLDCPFRALDAILQTYSTQTFAGIIVDFHAETTSEKNAFGLYADGKATVVVGTHTHVPTADERVLPNGTAYITDIGMVGLQNSVIGFDSGPLQSFLTQLHHHFEISDSGTVVFNAVLIDIDTATRKATSITRIQREIVV